MKYTIELTDTEYNVLTGFMDMISSEIKAEYFKKTELEPAEKAWEDELEKAKLLAYKNGFEHGNKIADKGLKEIQDSTYDVAYNKGIEDFENLFVYEHDYEQFFEDTYGSKSPDYNLYDLVAKYGAKKVFDDFKKWQEKKKKAEDEIKVGDEVICNCPNEQRVIITAIYNDWVTFMRKDGACYSRVAKDMKKTGRHFDEVSQLLDKLRGKK